MEMALVGLVTGVVGSLATIVVSKITASGQTKSKEIEASGPNWDAFVERVEKHNEKATKRLEEDFNRKIDHLSNKVEQLEAWKRRMSDKYQILVAHLVRWWRKYPGDELVQELPDEIKEDFPRYQI